MGVLAAASLGGLGRELPDPATVHLPVLLMPLLVLIGLGTAGAVALSTSRLWAQGQDSADGQLLHEAISRLEYLTREEDFINFGRGTPPPHTLPPEKLRAEFQSNLFAPLIRVRDFAALDRPGRIVNLLDRQVPVWQLALHDLVTLEQCGMGWKEAMNAILFGRVMRDEWSAEPGIMPVLDDARVARFKAIYDLVTDRHGHLVTQRLTHWEPLADRVERTRFADGTEVVADFAEGRLTVNGKGIPCPAALA